MHDVTKRDATSFQRETVSYVFAAREARLRCFLDGGPFSRQLSAFCVDVGVISALYC